MSNDKKNITVQKLMTNPCIWAVVIGIIIFLLPVKPFAPMMEAVASMGNLNTPLAMIVLGSYLAKCNLIDLFKNIRIYSVSCLRLVVLPFIVMLLLKFVPEQYENIKLTVFIAASAPVGALLPVFAQMYGRDTEYGAGIVSMSTLLSILTLPIFIMLVQMAW